MVSCSDSMRVAYICLSVIYCAFNLLGKYRPLRKNRYG